MADYLRNIVKLQKQGKPVGIYSACTGNRLVLEACMRHAMETGTVLLIESTANQVDQYGGYTGMKPADFMEMCKELAKEVGMPMERIILGGDHLGPLTFAGYDEEKAMSEARELIRQYVAAGFTKIHIDTSMKVASDDPDTRLADGIHPEEINQTASLIRGIAAAIRQRGYQPRGFNACVISDVPGGSGLSSSAAFETLIGVIFNHMFCADALDSVEIAKIGQYAENVYFGKPCGLMDQMACSVGGAIAIDFAQKEQPVITKIPFSFADSGYQLCIIDSGADHADLTEDYAAVPAEMKSVAHYFGKEVLREVPEDQFREEIASLRKACGDRAVLRASHFYKENDRVKSETEALLAGDFRAYLKTAGESGRSSFMYLQNVYSSRFPDQQAVAVALMAAEHLLAGKGMCRVHGGGFAGTIQAFVPTEDAEAFRRDMDSVLGEGSCRILQIRPYGGIVIA